MWNHFDIGGFPWEPDEVILLFVEDVVSAAEQKCLQVVNKFRTFTARENEFTFTNT